MRSEEASGSTSSGSALRQQPLPVIACLREAQADELLILSARYGVVDPEQEIDAYEHRLSTRRDEHSRWSALIRLELERRYGGIPTEFIVLAGADYSRGVPHREGWTITMPLSGLGIGERLSALKRLLEMAGS